MWYKLLEQANPHSTYCVKPPSTHAYPHVNISTSRLTIPPLHLNQWAACSLFITRPPHASAELDPQKRQLQKTVMKPLHNSYIMWSRTQTTESPIKPATWYWTDNLMQHNTTSPKLTAEPERTSFYPKINPFPDSVDPSWLYPKYSSLSCLQLLNLNLRASS